MQDALRQTRLSQEESVRTGSREPHAVPNCTVEIRLLGARNASELNLSQAIGYLNMFAQITSRSLGASRICLAIYSLRYRKTGI